MPRPTAREKRIRAKRAKGVTKLVRQGRPGQLATLPPGTRPKRGFVKLLKGQISAKARAALFAKQARFRSIIRRRKAPEARFATPKEFVGIADGTVIERRAVNSSWVREILLVMWSGAPRLGVKFKDGASIVYTTTNLTDWKHMAGAASKGKFIWAALYKGVPHAGAPYDVMTGRTLGVTRKAAKKAKRPRFPAPF
jgi:hypothetical protein